MSVNKKEIPMEWYQLYFACGISWLVLTGLMVWFIDRRLMARQREFFARLERDGKRAATAPIGLLADATRAASHAEALTQTSD